MRRVVAGLHRTLGRLFGAATGEHVAQTFRLLGHVSKRDGRVSPAEIRVAEAAMQRLGLDATGRRRAQQWFAEGKAAGFDAADALRRLARACRDRPTRARQSVEWLVMAARADGAVRPPVEAQLIEWAAVLGLGRAEYEHLAAPHAPRRPAAPRARGAQAELLAAYAVLGVPADAEDAAVRAAYRRLLARHHPDKLAGLGADRHAQRAGAEVVQDLTAAWDRVRAARGL
jgi:DnaJ like chaperone protein